MYKLQVKEQGQFKVIKVYLQQNYNSKINGDSLFLKLNPMDPEQAQTVNAIIHY